MKNESIRKDEELKKYEKKYLELISNSLYSSKYDLPLRISCPINYNEDYQLEKIHLVFKRDFINDNYLFLIF